MSDDPIDAFDKIAEDIRRKQDELDAAEKLRADKTRERQQEPHGNAADGEPPERPD